MDTDTILMVAYVAIAAVATKWALRGADEVAVGVAQETGR